MTRELGTWVPHACGPRSWPPCNNPPFPSPAPNQDLVCAPRDGGVVSIPVADGDATLEKVDSLNNFSGFRGPPAAFCASTVRVRDVSSRSSATMQGRRFLGGVHRECVCGEVGEERDARRFLRSTSQFCSGQEGRWTKPGFSHARRSTTYFGHVVPRICFGGSGLCVKFWARWNVPFARLSPAGKIANDPGG